MSTDLSEVWGAPPEDPPAVSAKVADVAAKKDPRDVMHELLLREILSLRKEQEQRASMTVVIALVFLSIVIHYLDGLKAQIRRLEVSRQM